ncbi:HAMP domain-containing sensor histidine kinase [Enterococcus hirae]|uniref:HAMP domain-containing sensor histidine kinase n=1 Tax=Enterococcus hirae TaxID=1354 RepID=UPI00370E1EEC
MKKKLYSQLWIYFASIVFVSILVTLLCFLGFIFLLSHQNVTPSERPTLYPLFVFAFFSMIVGTVISGFVGHRILKPISELRKNMSKVATGDFSIRMEEPPKVAEVQQLYKDFNVMVQELNSIETLRNDFVSSVSHEFKTPLATIQGYVQLLQAPDIPEEEKQVFLQPKWEGLKLHIDLDTVFYEGNEEFLYQVWLNIMDNAIKYNQPDGKIEIRLTQNATDILLEVTDSGVGMNEETQNRIFEKFYQGDTSRQMAGNGLGLSLVKKILELHEGTIRYNSIPEVGTTAVISLKK